MKRSTLTKGLLFLWFATLFGCANSEEIHSRRGESIDANGASYAPKDTNDAFVFGVESDGLSSNPKSKPGKAELGPSGVFEELELSVAPESETAHINEMVEFKVSFDGMLTGASKEPRFVITLERAPGANGSLIVDSGDLYDAEEFPPTDSMAVISKPKGVQKGSFTVRVQTGSMYSSKNPMYYLNFWAADASDPASAEINVRTIPKMSDCTLGTKDVENDLTVPSEINDAETKMTEAALVNLDSLDQQLYADFSKKLGVRLDGKCAASGAETGDDAKTACDLTKETICFSFVETTTTNTGFVTSYFDNDEVSEKNASGQKPYKADGDSATGKAVACGHPNANGEFWVEINTSMAYNARYFLNFFHKVANPLTYQIDTFALPDTLGEPGDPAVIINDDIKIPVDLTDPDVVVTDSETGKETINGGNAAQILASMFPEPIDKDSEPVKSIIEACGDFTSDAAKNQSGKDCDPNAAFHCKLEKNDNGTWDLKTCDGKKVQADVDGDGIADDIHVVINEVVTCKDKNGNKVSEAECDAMKDGECSCSSEFYNGGFDVDGDGTSDVAPDPCLYEVCGSDYIFRCKYDKKDEYGSCKKLSIGISTTQDIFVRAVSKNDTSKLKALDVTAKLTKGSLPSNNGAFDAEGNTDTEITFSTSSDANKDTKFTFWAGTAYDATYMITLVNKDAKAATIVIAVNNSFSVPTAEGDKANKDDALIPPGGMPNYDPNLGNVKLVLPDDVSAFEQILSAPVVKTLDLKVKVIKDNQYKTLVADTKTYWKISRGKSVNNNATLNDTMIVTNSKGVASNYFYTGTGYNSLYYVSVFHPNYIDEETKKPIPFIFTITITNNTGTIPGVNPNDVDLPDGDTTNENGDFCCTKLDGEKCVEPCTTSSKAETCNANDKTYKSCAGEYLDTVNGYSTNPKYPQGSACSATCSDNTFKNCDENSAEACCKEAFNTSGPQGKQGCLSLIFLSPQENVGLGETINYQAKIVWKNGNEITPVRDKLIWKLKGNDGADASLNAETSPTDRNGIATIIFKSGSKQTTYNLSVMYPNIHNDEGNMIPETIQIVVKDMPPTPSVTEINHIKLEADGTNVQKLAYNGVSYYILSSDDHSCSENFLVANESSRKTNCLKAEPQDSLHICDLEKVTEAGDNKYYPKELILDNHKDKYIVFAVGDSGSSPLVFGCSAMNRFGSPTTPNTCDDSERLTTCKNSQKDKDGKCKCAPVRRMDVKVLLSEIPLSFAESYKTESLFDLGPLMKDGSKVKESIDKIMTKYEEFLDADPAKKVMEELDTYVFFDGDNTNTTKCVENSQKKNKCMPSDGSNVSKLESICEINSGQKYKDCFDDKGKEDKDCLKKLYTKCDCTCAKFYYYTHINSIGKKIAPLARKGIKSLLDKYLSADAIAEQLCKVFDSVQYLTLTGDLTLEKDGNSGKFKGSAKYNGALIPFTGDKKLELPGNIVEGKWTEAKLTNGIDQLAITKFSLNLTYGEFIYQVIGKFIGAIDDSGNLSFANILDCSKLGNISLPLLGSVDLSTFCELSLNWLSGQTVSFAVSKYASLNLTLDGTGEFQRGKLCVAPAAGIGCVAQQIVKGSWTGTGSLGETKADGKKPEDTIGGAWIAYKDENDKPTMELSGGKSLDEFKAKNSVCRKVLKEAKEGAQIKDHTNQACLGGSFSDPSSWAKNNRCDKTGCQGAGVVVCTEEGKFNTEYAGATATQIILSANNECKKNCEAFTTCGDPTCDLNSEIINNGYGVTNEECLTHCKDKACQDNDTIVVCSGGSAVESWDVNICEKPVDQSAPLSDEDSAKCFEAQVKTACKGKCDSPVCLMNKELKGCTDETDKPAPTPTSLPELLASWSTFDQYWNKDTKKSSPIDKADIKPDTDSKNAAAAKFVFSCESAKLKIVAGEDGVVGALGTDLAVGGKDKCHFSLTTKTDAFEITKIELSVFGDGRTIVINDKKNATKEGEWLKLTLDPVAENNIWPIIVNDKGIEDTNATDEGYKMMRLDNIKVYGIDKAQNNDDKKDDQKPEEQKPEEQKPGGE